MKKPPPIFGRNETTSPIVKPRRVRRGEVVAVVAPSGPVDGDAVAAGVEMLEARGYCVRLGSSVGARRNYLAGSDAERAADLDAAVRDPAVAAIFAARGGYGCGRLLSRLDLLAFRRARKAVVGHSDVTFLLNALVERSRVVTFHGPMVAGFPARPEALDTLLAMLEGSLVSPVAAASVIRAGVGEGRLVGGCLSVVAAMIGTPYALRTEGCLLFLEDINERPFRIDRMLTQLKQAGWLDGLAGLLFGEMPRCFEGEGVMLAELVEEVCGEADYPVVAGVPSGHGTGTVTLPLGCRARLEGAELRFLEAAVE